MFVPGKLFQPCIMFVGKTKSLPKSGGPERTVLHLGRDQPCMETLSKAGKACQ